MVVTDYFAMAGKVLTYRKKTIPIQAWTGRLGSRRLRLPEFLDSRKMKVVRWQVLSTGRL